MIILWICEPVVGGLLGVAAVVILGVATSTYRVIIAFGVITCILSAFVSNTATVAMLMPTALGILAVIAELMQDRGMVRADFDPLRLRVGAALMLMLAYGASVGGPLTPVGSPPNLIGRGLIEEATGERISFAQWTATAAPRGLAMFAVLALMMFLLNKQEVRPIDGVAEYIRAQRAARGRMSRAEVNTQIAFGFTVTLWLLPAMASLVTGTGSGLYLSGRPAGRGYRGRTRSFVAVHPARQLERTTGHAHLVGRRQNRLGDNPALKHR